MSGVLDVAQGADRAALFAGLQAAMCEIVDLASGSMSLTYDRLPTFREKYAHAERRVLEALQRGDTYGSPTHLAEIAERLGTEREPS